MSIIVGNNINIKKCYLDLGNAAGDGNHAVSAGDLIVTVDLGLFVRGPNSS
jgi:hypothetical protein